MPVDCISSSKKAVGKIVKNTKFNYKWTLILDGQDLIVSLSESMLSSKVRVDINHSNLYCVKLDDDQKKQGFQVHFEKIHFFFRKTVDNFQLYINEEQFSEGHTFQVHKKNNKMQKTKQAQNNSLEFESTQFEPLNDDEIGTNNKNNDQLGSFNFQGMESDSDDDFNHFGKKDNVKVSPTKNKPKNNNIHSSGNNYDPFTADFEKTKQNTVPIQIEKNPAITKNILNKNDPLPNKEFLGFESNKNDTSEAKPSNDFFFKFEKMNLKNESTKSKQTEFQSISPNLNKLASNKIESTVTFDQINQMFSSASKNKGQTNVRNTPIDVSLLDVQFVPPKNNMNPTVQLLDNRSTGAIQSQNSVPPTFSSDLIGPSEDFDMYPNPFSFEIPNKFNKV